MKTTNSHKIALICALYSLSLWSFGQQIERQLIASSGLSSSSQMSIGEVVLSSGSLQITVGFHQPDFIESTALGFHDVSRQLSVYPVPTRDQLTIDGPIPWSASTVVRFYDLLGNELNVNLTTESKRLQLDLEGIISGRYALVITDSQSGVFASYQIVKLD